MTTHENRAQAPEFLPAWMAQRRRHRALLERLEPPPLPCLFNKGKARGALVRARDASKPRIWVQETVCLAIPIKAHTYDPAGAADAVGATRNPRAIKPKLSISYAGTRAVDFRGTYRGGPNTIHSWRMTTSANAPGVHTTVKTYSGCQKPVRCAQQAVKLDVQA